MPRRIGIAAAVVAALIVIAIVIGRFGVPPVAATPPGAFSFGVFGDAPYFLDEELRYPILLKHIDAHDLRFVIHVGDIFWRPCSDEHYAEVLRHFNGLHEPVVYTPGDNEWTDCWERGSGSYAPLERLARIRQIFFAHPSRSLGRSQLALVSQGGEFVENARWAHAGVVFATVNLPGSGNATKQFPARTAADDAEVLRRTAAAASWTRAAFAEATATSARAVVIAFQAEIEYGKPESFAPFVDAVKEEAARFGKPVLLAHGDGHIFIVDHPLPQRNVTRMQVPGSPEVGWVRVVVTPDTRFEFTKIVVPAWKYW
ncbi:MAG TPA: hypothetical protein VJZ76_19300 [Thermoanaerobaculia bacterium]|nr:hypothetical protein [Thermoanaerobaculia bacterium]